MKNKNFKRILIPAVLLIICGVLLFTVTSNSPNAEPKPTPTSTAEKDLESIVSYNAEQALQLVNVNIEEQLSEEEITQLEATTDSISETDENGNPVKIALIAIQKLPVTFDVENSTNFVKEFIQNPSQEGNDWEFKEANEEEFEPDTGIVKSIIAWEGGENPVNPAVLTFTWKKVIENEQITGYELHIQAQAS